MNQYLCFQWGCYENATLICTHCHDSFCKDHMIGYICEACDDEDAEILDQN